MSDPADAPSLAFIDTTNDVLVGTQSGGVTILMPPTFPMTPAQATRMAAWLLAIATTLDPNVEQLFAPTLEAIRNT